MDLASLPSSAHHINKVSQNYSRWRRFYIDSRAGGKARYRWATSKLRGAGRGTPLRASRSRWQTASSRWALLCPEDDRRARLGRDESSSGPHRNQLVCLKRLPRGPETLWRDFEGRGSFLGDAHHRETVREIFLQTCFQSSKFSLVLITEEIQFRNGDIKYSSLKVGGVSSWHTFFSLNFPVTRHVVILHPFFEE